MEYNEIEKHFHKGDMIKSLSDGKIRKYSGFLTLVGVGENQIGMDSLDDDLIVYQNEKLAEIIN